MIGKHCSFFWMNAKNLFSRLKWKLRLKNDKRPPIFFFGFCKKYGYNYRFCVIMKWNISCKIYLIAYLNFIFVFHFKVYIYGKTILDTACRLGIWSSLEIQKTRSQRFYTYFTVIFNPTFKFSLWRKVITVLIVV